MSKAENTKGERWVSWAVKLSLWSRRSARGKSAMVGQWDAISDILEPGLVEQ